MTHILDSDHVTIWEIGHGTEYAALSANMARHQASDVGLSVVSLREQLLGAHTRILNAKSDVQLVNGFHLMFEVMRAFRTFPMVAYDTAAHTEFLKLKSAKIRVGTPDLRIAATALANNLTLVTRNTSDFAQVPGLTIEDWTK